MHACMYMYVYICVCARSFRSLVLVSCLGLLSCYRNLMFHGFGDNMRHLYTYDTVSLFAHQAGQRSRWTWLLVTQLVMCIWSSRSRSTVVYFLLLMPAWHAATSIVPRPPSCNRLKFDARPLISCTPVHSRPARPGTSMFSGLPCERQQFFQEKPSLTQELKFQQGKPHWDLSLTHLFS